MVKKVRILYKRTRIELPQEQSSELCGSSKPLKNAMKAKRSFVGLLKKRTYTKMEKEIKPETLYRTFGRKIERVSLQIRGKMVSFMLAGAHYS